MSEIDIRVEGRAGRITLHRPKALNALNSAMVSAIDDILPKWAADPGVEVVVIDAEGDKAFCAGGDLTEIYEAGTRGDFSGARAFWRMEYRMNAMLAEFPKPIISLLQGYTMGGGVGLGCHASHRIVCENSRIAMPEVGVGLVPDVGGSLLLARAPGHLGSFLACTTRRMPPADAIMAGFADHFVPRSDWSGLLADLQSNADPRAVVDAAQPLPESELERLIPDVELFFAATTLTEILSLLDSANTEFSRTTLASMQTNDPLAMAATVQVQQALYGETDIRTALELEFRYSYRSAEDGDFLEGIRALIIDKDRAPKWRHQDRDGLEEAAAAMLAPLGDQAWTFEQGETA